MAGPFLVRIYGYQGIVRSHALNEHQLATDSVMMLIQPYLWGQVLTTNGSVPVSTSVNSPDSARLIRVEVADGNTIRYEINTPTRSVQANANSPALTGINQLYWGSGWTMSLIDATGT